jgi:hypothetical protein
MPSDFYSGQIFKPHWAHRQERDFGQFDLRVHEAHDFASEVTSSFRGNDGAESVPVGSWRKLGSFMHGAAPGLVAPRHS